jgi:hypothetical protein
LCRQNVSAQLKNTNIIPDGTKLKN